MAREYHFEEVPGLPSVKTVLGIEAVLFFIFMVLFYVVKIVFKIIAFIFMFIVLCLTKIINQFKKPITGV